MWDGFSDVVPIQGAVVAAVLLGVSVFKIVRGARGSEAATWNTIGIICFIYLFAAAGWLLLGNPG